MVGVTNIPGHPHHVFMRSAPQILGEPRFFFFALVYGYVNTEITPGISRDGFRNVFLAVRAEACGRLCGSMMLAEALGKLLATIRKT